MTTTLKVGDDLWHITKDSPGVEFVTVSSVDERKGVIVAGPHRFSLKTLRGVHGTAGHAQIAGEGARLGQCRTVSHRIHSILQGTLPPRETQARLLRLLLDTEYEVTRILRGEP